MRNNYRNHEYYRDPTAGQALGPASIALPSGPGRLRDIVLLRRCSMTNNYPRDLVDLPYWLCWRYEKDPKSEKDRKVPYNPKTGKRASSTNMDQWANLDVAQEAHQQYMYNGLGFVFTREA